MYSQQKIVFLLLGSKEFIKSNVTPVNHFGDTHFNMFSKNIGKPKAWVAFYQISFGYVRKQ